MGIGRETLTFSTYTFGGIANNSLGQKCLPPGHILGGINIPADVSVNTAPLERERAQYPAHPHAAHGPESSHGLVDNAAQRPRAIHAHEVLIERLPAPEETPGGRATTLPRRARRRRPRQPERRRRRPAHASPHRCPPAGHHSADPRAYARPLPGRARSRARRPHIRRRTPATKPRTRGRSNAHHPASGRASRRHRGALLRLRRR